MTFLSFHSTLRGYSEEAELTYYENATRP